MSTERLRRILVSVRYRAANMLSRRSTLVNLQLCLLCLSAGSLPSQGREDGHETYDNSPGYPDRWQLSTLPSPNECSPEYGRALLVGLVAGAFLKLPLLILGKLLLVKAAAPLAAVAALLPLGLYSLYRGTADKHNGTKPAETRLFTDSCLQFVACSLGASAPRAAPPTTLWMMKMMEWCPLGARGRGLVSSYTGAYLEGSEGGTSLCGRYPCQLY